MTADPLPRLVGRHGERAMLQDLVLGLRSRRPGGCVLRGEAGIGKSVLLDELAATAPGVALARAQGIEADMELAFASVQQLCSPFLRGSTTYRARSATLCVSLSGCLAGEPPDRFLVGLAVLTLLTRASEDHPVLLVVRRRRSGSTASRSRPSSS